MSHLRTHPCAPAETCWTLPLQLTCWCDRYWGPVERCRLPGARQTRLPFVCPMDHILEPFHFANNPGPAGPPIRFREYSFLENDRTPKALKVRPGWGVTGVQWEGHPCFVG